MSEPQAGSGDAAIPAAEGSERHSDDDEAADGRGLLPRRADSPTTTLRAPTVPPEDTPAQPKPAPEKRASRLQQMATAAPKPPTAPDGTAPAPAQPKSAPARPAGAPERSAHAPAASASAPEKPADTRDEPADTRDEPAGTRDEPADAPPKPSAAPGAAATAAMPAPAQPTRAPAQPQPTPPAGPGTRATTPLVPPRPEAFPLPGSEQTKQQPLPPYEQKRPLDLLAELTNTPPPPETPLRTVLRRVKIYSPLVVLLAIAFVVVQLLRPLPDPQLTLTARATYGFDGAKPSLPWPSEGQAAVDVVGLGSLGSYGKQKPVPIASVAKVMTAYLMLRDHPVKGTSNGAYIPVDRKAADDARTGAEGHESVVDVKAGSKISQREALKAIMIASANNVARLIARWDAGSEEAFVKKMNDAAKELGMDDTHYTDPSGLKHSTVSTAADQVRLAKLVMKDPLFRAVVKLPKYTDSQGVDYRNWNGLVPLNHTVGIKTGTTPGAGGNLLFAAEREIAGTKQLIIGAVLGQYKPPIIDTVLAEGAKLIDSAQQALTDKKIVRKGDVVGEVDDGLGGTVPVVASRDVTAVGWPGLKVTLDIGPRGNGKVPHEAKAGDVVGELTVGGGQGEVTVPVKLQKDLAEPGAGAKLTRLG